MGGMNGSLTSREGLVDSLRTMILDGVLPPGSPVRERDLCSRFGVSRTPLREALKVLGSEGHVVLETNRGARVTTLTGADVEDLFQVTGALEALAGELACGRAGDAEIAALRTMHDEMSALHAKRELEPYYLLNRRIHEQIVRLAGNAILAGLYNQVNARIRRARFITPLPITAWDKAMSEHVGIMNALERRDGATAAAILKTHLRDKGKSVVAAGYATPEPPPTPRRRVKPVSG